MPAPTFLLQQPARGYRFNVASLVLAAHVADRGPADSLLEVGTGVGVVSLLLAETGLFSRLEGIEIQEVMYSYAIKNRDDNSALLKAPLTLHLGDVRAWRERWAPGSFQRVIANPPFFKVEHGHPSPDPVTRMARSEVCVTSEALLEAAAGLLAPEGVGVFLYPIQRGFEVAAQARSLGLHVRRRAARSFADHHPFLAIVEVAQRPFPDEERERPLTLYDDPHRYQAWLQPWVDRISKPKAREH